MEGHIGHQAMVGERAQPSGLFLSDRGRRTAGRDERAVG
jgi:hypothetical protein